MSLTAAEVAEIMRVVEQSKFDELRLDLDGLKLILRRSGASGSMTSHVATPSTEQAAAPEDTAVAPGASRGAMTSPMLGTFYRAPAPGAESYVRIGSKIEVGTVLCIVEAMKLMNEIPSDVTGEVVEIYVENGHPIEYGQKLFGIRPHK